MPPETPEDRLSRIEARLSAVDAADERLSHLEARMERFDDLERRVAAREPVGVAPDAPPPAAVQTPRPRSRPPERDDARVDVPSRPVGHRLEDNESP